MSLIHVYVDFFPMFKGFGNFGVQLCKSQWMFSISVSTFILVLFSVQCLFPPWLGVPDKLCWHIYAFCTYLWLSELVHVHVCLIFVHVSICYCSIIITYSGSLFTLLIFGIQVVPLLMKAIGWQGGSILALETLKRVVAAGNRARDALVAQGLK